LAGDSNGNESHTCRCQSIKTADALVSLAARRASKTVVCWSSICTCRTTLNLVYRQSALVCNCSPDAVRRCYWSSQTATIHALLAQSYHSTPRQKEGHQRRGGISVLRTAERGLCPIIAATLLAHQLAWFLLDYISEAQLIESHLWSRILTNRMTKWALKMLFSLSLAPISIQPDLSNKPPPSFASIKELAASMRTAVNSSSSVDIGPRLLVDCVVRC
jgi:hypothetical protein